MPNLPLKRKVAKELKAIKAEVPGWTKLSKHGEAEMRRVAEDIAKTCEELAKRQKACEDAARRRSLPQLAIVGERDLPPQVELTFDMSDEDFARLLGKAMLAIPTKDQANLVVGEFLRRALTEMVERMPKPPPQRCGNCRWFDTTPAGKRGLCVKALDRSAMCVPDSVNLDGPSIMLSHGGRKCQCHQYRIEEQKK